MISFEWLTQFELSLNTFLGWMDSRFRFSLLSNNLKAQKGDTVSIHYLGKYVGGQVFDTSIESEARKSGLYSPARDYKPLQVKLGAGQVIQGFEEAILGMAMNFGEFMKNVK